MSNSKRESTRLASTPNLLRVIVIICPLLVSGFDNVLQAQCPPSDLQDSFTDVQVAASPSRNATVGMVSLSTAGAIIVAYEGSEIMAAYFSPSGVAVGAPFALTQQNATPYPEYDCEFPETKFDPSLAVSSNEAVTVAFITRFGNCRLYVGGCQYDEDCSSFIPRCGGCDTSPNPCVGGYCYLPVRETLMHSVTFPFGNVPAPVESPLSFLERTNSDPSAGIDSNGNGLYAWANPAGLACARDAPFGWLYGPNADSGIAIVSCVPNSCDNSATCFYAEADPQPCISRRSDGYTLVAWSDPESPGDEFAPFNIKLQLYAPSGAAIGGQVWVNDTGTGIVEVDPSSQVSPAVAMDDPDENGRSNIVVTWAGPYPPGVENFAIYARRFVLELGSNPPSTAHIRDPIASLGEGARSDFIVNNQPGGPLASALAHPSVALTSDANHRGRFIIAWNSHPPVGLSGDEIHGQFFKGDGRPMGCEFRMHAGTGGTNGIPRSIAASARHTLAYASNGNVAVAYTIDPYGEVWFSLIPAGTAETLDEAISCCKGDVDRNGSVNGRDIQPFINKLLLSNPQTLSAVELCPADVDENSLLEYEDVAPFVMLLLEAATCPSGTPSRGMADCNSNSIPDANDIAAGTSQDCNANFIPDECDIDTNDPDGDGLVSADVDADGVPDECQPDCNGNSRPDIADIACGGGNTCGEIAGSYDVNSNGIPDECEPDCNANGRPDDADIACGGGNTCNGIAGSYDCNLNGTPDECEQDCNENGVPDDCDIDPSDPDGNQDVSPDCNNNGNPDDCDLELPPPFGSLDCNANGVPDECDIADETSLDENENGIPDECEGGQGQAAPGGNSSGLGAIDEADAKSGSEDNENEPGLSMTMQAPAPDAAWIEFYEWSFAQCWGPNCEATPSEQFQSYVAKLTELGLPIMGVQGSP